MNSKSSITLVVAVLAGWFGLAVFGTTYLFFTAAVVASWSVWNRGHLILRLTLVLLVPALCYGSVLAGHVIYLGEYLHSYAYDCRLSLLGPPVTPCIVPWETPAARYAQHLVQTHWIYVASTSLMVVTFILGPMLSWRRGAPTSIALLRALVLSAIALQIAIALLHDDSLRALNACALGFTC